MITTNWIVRTLLAASLGTLPAATSQTQPHAKSGDRVIVRLACRQQTISILSTPTGVRYSAADTAGHEFFSAIPLETLKADHPEIYRLIAPTFCRAEDCPVAIGTVAE
jgi:hypothetical protein